MPREAPVTSRAFADMQRPSAERSLDVLGQRLRLVARRVAAQNAALPVDQELGEIPLDRLRAEEAGRCLLQRLEQRVGVQAIDLDLGEHRERHVVFVGTELSDLGLVAWLLMA